MEDRQKYVFSKVCEVLREKFSFNDKAQARSFFHNLRHRCIDWNYKKWQSNEFKEQEKEIDSLLKGEENEESLH
jgi:V/A-type H+-transporting ATPase subunit A